MSIRLPDKLTPTDTRRLPRPMTLRQQIREILRQEMGRRGRARVGKEGRVVVR